LDLKEVRDDEVLGCSGITWTICKQAAPHSRQITTPTPHHSILTGQVLFLTSNRVKALKAYFLSFLQGSMPLFLKVPEFPYNPA